MLAQKLHLHDKNILAWLAVLSATVIWFILDNLIEPFANWLAYGLLALPQDSRMGQSLAFFFYDAPKLLLLLSGMIFAISLVQTFIDAQKVRAIVDKGASLGTVLAFMMSVIALSLPEMIILRRVLKPQLIAIFIGVIDAAIIIAGYLFNIVI